MTPFRKDRPLAFGNVMTFDKLIQDISASYHFGPKGRVLVEEAVDLIARQPGGMSGFLERFRVAGFGDDVASWLEGASPVPLSGQEVEQALGSDTVREIAHKVGASQSFVRTVLGYAIPKIISLFARSGLSDLALPLAFPPAEERAPRGPEQIPVPRAWKAELRGLAPLCGSRRGSFQVLRCSLCSE